MRSLTKLLLLFFLLVSSVALAGSMDTVNVKGQKLKDFLVYKTSRKFLGATVEIISSRGNVIALSKLEKRKLVIDFGDVRPGPYTIRVSKGQLKEEFVYVRK